MAMSAVEATGTKKYKPKFGHRPRILSLPTRSFLRWAGSLFLLASFFMAFRQFQLLLHFPDNYDPKSQTPSLSRTGQLTSEDSVNLWRRVETNFPPEINAPDPNLYGRGKEHCFAIGKPNVGVLKKGDPALFWQMNSRALCYIHGPTCFYGHSLNYILTYERRGAGRCSVVDVSQAKLHDARESGLNESCAKWRERQVINMFGDGVIRNFDQWQELVTNTKIINPRHHVVGWESNFAIVVPKYDWSYNICHFNRIWNFIMYVIRNLSMFVPDADKIETIDIRFRSGFQYKEHWHVGIRNATIPVLERETGKKITVGKIRFDFLRSFQCIKRGILLGREGRVDAFPFFNDTDVWHPFDQKDDTHVPVIPHDSLWLREVMRQAAGLPSVGKYEGPLIGNFTSIPVPPRRIGFLQRSPRSRRRLSRKDLDWFERMTQELCTKYNFKFEPMRTSSAQTLIDQVQMVSDLGMVVGLHGANIVNSMFIAPAGALFEIFPWRYVRYYYAAGGNAGLRYSFHEPEGGVDKKCSFESRTCFMKYRESLILLTDGDRAAIRARIEKSMRYIAALHRKYPDGHIPLRRVGTVYHFDT